MVLQLLHQASPPPAMHRQPRPLPSLSHSSHRLRHQPIRTRTSSRYVAVSWPSCTFMLTIILQLAQQQQAQQPPAAQRQAGQPQQLAIPVGPGGNIDVAAIQNQPQIQHLRQLMQQNPGLIQPIIQELATQNPQLTQLFAQNPAALAQIFGVPPEQLDLLEGLADELPQQVIEITPEERAAIQRVRNIISHAVNR